MEAELHSLLEAVRLASIESDERGYCEVYTDCRPLVSKIEGYAGNRADWQGYQDSAHWLLNKFDSWEVNYVARSHNEEAHDLARSALKHGRETLQYIEYNYHRMSDETFICQDCGSEFPTSAETNRKMCEYCFHELMGQSETLK